MPTYKIYWRYGQRDDPDPEVRRRYAGGEQEQEANSAEEAMAAFEIEHMNRGRDPKHLSMQAYEMLGKFHREDVVTALVDLTDGALKELIAEVIRVRENDVQG